MLSIWSPETAIALVIALVNIIVMQDAMKDVVMSGEEMSGEEMSDAGTIVTAVVETVDVVTTIDAATIAAETNAGEEITVATSTGGKRGETREGVWTVRSPRAPQGMTTL